MLPKLGLIIADSCQVDETINKATGKEVDTAFGPVEVKITDKWVVVCRSGFGGTYFMPHEYKTVAHLHACQALGVKEVVGVHTSGSLRPSLQPGMLVIPDDWINLACSLSTMTGARHLMTPTLSRRVRQNLVDAAWKAKVTFENGGTCWQTAGSRLETKAEIKLMSNFADLVGKAMASEAEMAQEMGLEYGAICSVDNYANGLGTPFLSDTEIWERISKSSAVITEVLANYPESTEPTLF